MYRKLRKMKKTISFDKKGYCSNNQSQYSDNKCGNTYFRIKIRPFISTFFICNFP